MATGNGSMHGMTAHNAWQPVEFDIFQLIYLLYYLPHPSLTAQHLS